LAFNFFKKSSSNLWTDCDTIAIDNFFTLFNNRAIGSDIEHKLLPNGSKIEQCPLFSSQLFNPCRSTLKMSDIKELTGNIKAPERSLERQTGAD